MKDCIQDYNQEFNMNNKNMQLVTCTSCNQDFMYYKLPCPNSYADLLDVIVYLGIGRLLRDWIALWGDN